ncbi:hypothetical protein Tco_0431807 [Tanacetum coccineum]
MCGTSSRISLISRPLSLIDYTVADITSCVEASRGLLRQSAPSILVDTQVVRRQSAHSILVDTEGLPELDVSRSINLNVSTLKLDQLRECNRCKLAGVKRTPSIARKRANNVFLKDLEGEAVEPCVRLRVLATRSQVGMESFDINAATRPHDQTVVRFKWQKDLRESIFSCQVFEASKRLGVNEHTIVDGSRNVFK